MHESTHHRAGLPSDPQRFLIPIELDRTRILSFDHRATFLIYQRYGAGFWRELFETDPNAVPDAKGVRSIRLRSLETFEFFLWAGLQRDADEAREKLTIEQIAEHILPGTIDGLVSALLLALAATRKPVDKSPNVEPAGAAAAPVVN
jgi:hypothetical protein